MCSPKLLCLPPVANTLWDLDMRFTLVWLVKWLWYRVHNQKVVSSSPCMFLFLCCCFLYFYLYSIRLTSFILDVPRPLSYFLWIIYSKGWCVTHILNQSVWNICVIQNRIVYVIKRLKPLFLDTYFQFCKYRHASKLFVYLYMYLHLFLLFLKDPLRERLPYARYVKVNLCAFDIFF